MVFFLYPLILPLKILLKIIKSLSMSELKYQMEKRPIVIISLAVIILIFIRSAFLANGIRNPKTFAQKLTDLILWIYKEIISTAVQLTVDVINGIIEYIIEFMFGLAIGIIDAFKSFKLPKIKVPKIDLGL